MKQLQYRSNGILNKVYAKWNMRILTQSEILSKRRLLQLPSFELIVRESPVTILEHQDKAQENKNTTEAYFVCMYVCMYVCIYIPHILHGLMAVYNSSIG